MPYEITGYSQSFGPHVSPGYIEYSATCDPYCPKLLASSFSEGLADQVGLSSPMFLAAGKGRIFCASYHHIYSIEEVGGKRLVSSFAGDSKKEGYRDGIGEEALFEDISSLAFDSTSGSLFAIDGTYGTKEGYGKRIRRIDSSGIVSTLPLPKAIMLEAHGNDPYLGTPDHAPLDGIAAYAGSIYVAVLGWKKLLLVSAAEDGTRVRIVKAIEKNGLLHQVRVLPIDGAEEHILMERFADPVPFSEPTNYATDLALTSYSGGSLAGVVYRENVAEGPWPKDPRWASRVGSDLLVTMNHSKLSRNSAAILKVSSESFKVVAGKADSYGGHRYGHLREASFRGVAGMAKASASILVADTDNSMIKVMRLADVR